MFVDSLVRIYVTQHPNPFVLFLVAIKDNNDDDENVEREV